MQTQDLFLDKKEILWERLKPKGFFNSHQVRAIGFEIGLDSADRRVREWAEIGPDQRLRTLDHKEILFRGLWKKGQAHLAWWEVI